MEKEYINPETNIVSNQIDHIQIHKYETAISSTRNMIGLIGLINMVGALLAVYSGKPDAPIGIYQTERLCYAVLMLLCAGLAYRKPYIGFAIALAITLLDTGFLIFFHPNIGAIMYVFRILIILPLVRGLSQVKKLEELTNYVDGTAF